MSRTPLRIIDNKKVDLTPSEWELYQEICKSYDRPNFSGKDLFKGLFETDDNGIIIFLRPPTSTYTSMEVYMFLVTVMIHQHIGGACGSAEALFKDIKMKFNQAAEKINSEIAELEKIKKEARKLIDEIKKDRETAFQKKSFEELAKQPAAPKKE